jgi:hypothetical protein
MHPFWSDARVAEVCGLSRRTIANLRLRIPELPDSRARGVGETKSLPSREARVGRDGRARPVKPETLRTKVEAALAGDGDASLRFIARKVGVSPETVRSVRLRRDKAAASRETDLPVQPIDTATADISREPASLPQAGKVTASSPVLQDDSACGSTEDGRNFAAWFDAHRLDELEAVAHVGAVPLSRLYTVVDEAERRAQLWSTFAQLLRNRLA